MNPKVRVAVSFLDDNLHREIYAAEVARVVRLSRSRLYHLFKSELGIPITQYLKKARMERACKLLRSSTRAVKAIAADVGYNDATHFEREFKKACGSTPSQYRAHHFASTGSKKELTKGNRRIR